MNSVNYQSELNIFVNSSEVYSYHDIRDIFVESTVLFFLGFREVDFSKSDQEY